MNEYEVYKKIRKKATIFGMPASNFYIMCSIDMAVFLIALGGLSIFKLIFIVLIWGIAYYLCAVVFNKSSKPSKIQDYKRR